MKIKGHVKLKGHMKDQAIVTPSFNLFDFDFLYPSIQNLPFTITANGNTQSPKAWYEGKDAGAATWAPRAGYGEVLSIAGTAGSFNQVSTLFHPINDQCVMFNNNMYYQGSTNAFLNIRTDHFCFEIIKGGALTGNDVFVSKRVDSTHHWRFDANYNTMMLMDAQNGGGLLRAASANYGTSQWDHILCFCNPSDNATTGTRVYLNGVASGSGVNFSTLGDLNLAAVVQVGKNADLGQGRSCIIQWAFWHTPTWFANGAGQVTEWASIAASRYRLLMALLPRQSRGTAAPYSYSRASQGFSRRVDTTGNYRYQKCGWHWPRVGERIDATSGKRQRGYLSERAATNLLLQSETLNTTWTKVALTSITDNSANGPDTTSILDGVIGDANNTSHGVSQVVTLTAAQYVLSCFVRAGNKTWVQLFNSTVANCTAYFDVSNAVLGTVGAGVIKAGVEDWGGGLMRVWMSFTGTAANHTMGCYSATADGGVSFSGDASTINTHMGCFQVEVNVSYPSSYIITTTASATRAADVLQYTGNDGNLGGVGSNGKGVLLADVIGPSYPAGATELASRVIVETDAAGSANDSMKLEVGTNLNVLAETAKTGGNAGSDTAAVSLMTGSLVRAGLHYETNKLFAFGNSTTGPGDTSVDPPVGQTLIEIGCDQAGANQPNLMISRVRHFTRVDGKVVVHDFPDSTP
jgi:hypothetical protein